MPRCLLWRSWLRLNELLRPVSAPQLKVVTDAVAVAPDALATLLPMVVDGASHQELCDTATRLRAASRCRETAWARRLRVHEFRHLRWHQDPNGGIRGEFFCDEVAWSRVLPGLESRAKERWQSAEPGRDTIDAHRLDAFLDLWSGPSGSGARPHTIVLVDAEALRRAARCQARPVRSMALDRFRSMRQSSC